MKKKDYFHQGSVHHIQPRSKGGANKSENFATLLVRDHENYHHLFENMTPQEILEILVSYFWKSMDGQDGMRFIQEFITNKKATK